MSALGQKINWDQIDAITEKIVFFLYKPYKTDVDKFMTWYESLDRTKVGVVSRDNKMLKQWLHNGIPYMKKIIELMNREIKKIENGIEKIFALQISLLEKHQLSKDYYENIKTVLETIVDFLGCRNDLGQWYVNLLKLYTDDPAIKSNIDNSINKS